MVVLWPNLDDPLLMSTKWQNVKTIISLAHFGEPVSVAISYQYRLIRFHENTEMTLGIIYIKNNWQVNNTRITYHGSKGDGPGGVIVDSDEVNQESRATNK